MTTVMRPWEWSFPPRAEYLELLDVQPAQETGKPPLLFLHGLGHGAWCYAENWLPAAAERGYPSYALSLRGHGGSGGYTKLRRTTVRDYVHDVLQAVSRLPSPPVIIAHSLGSLVAQRVLPRYPARAGVLMSPLPLSGLRRSVVDDARSRPGDVLRMTAAGTLPLTADVLFADLDPATAAAYASRMGPESPWAQYSMVLPKRAEPITVPLLVVGAERDALLAKEDVQRCADALDAPITWVPGGHDIMLDGNWETALDTILAWVGRICPPESPPLPGAVGQPPLSALLGP